MKVCNYELDHCYGHRTCETLTSDETVEIHITSTWLSVVYILQWTSISCWGLIFFLFLFFCSANWYWDIFGLWSIVYFCDVVSVFKWYWHSRVRFVEWLYVFVMVSVYTSDIDTALICGVLYIPVMSVSLSVSAVGVDKIYIVYWFDTARKERSLIKIWLEW
jgi:hypothetical protein